MTAPIAFIDLAAQRSHMAEAMDRAIATVLDHGGYILGPEVGALETALAEFVGVSRAITCANGTDALMLALLAADVGVGDAVFVPAFTFAATAEAVARCGATPVFVDVKEADFNLDPTALTTAIDAIRHDGELRATAIIAVDLFGQPADYTALTETAQRFGMHLICDAAQSYGATYNGRHAAALGLAATTSFYPAKPLGCYGDGGAVFTNDSDLADRIVSLRNHGAGGDRYEHIMIGMNSRLDTLQAAILLVKLRHFPQEIEARNRIAARYDAALGNLVPTPRLMDGRSSVWAQYTIRLQNREAVRAALSESGIPTAVHYPVPLHRQPAYRNYPVGPGGAPVSEILSREVVSLPMHAYLSEADQTRIIEAIRQQTSDTAAS